MAKAAKKTAKKAASKTSSKEKAEKNVLAGDVDSQDDVVTEVEQDEEESDVIVAEPRVAGDRGAKKVFPSTRREPTEKEISRAQEGDARATKRKLAQEDTTKFMIPFGIGEKHGAVETVTINGYRLTIKKGVLVEIPLTVAKLLMKHLDVRSEVAEKFALHRDEATEEALS